MGTGSASTWRVAPSVRPVTRAPASAGANARRCSARGGVLYFGAFVCSFICSFACPFACFLEISIVFGDSDCYSETVRVKRAHTRATQISPQKRGDVVPLPKNHARFRLRAVGSPVGAVPVQVPGPLRGAHLRVTALPGGFRHRTAVGRRHVRRLRGDAAGESLREEPLSERGHLRSRRERDGVNNFYTNCFLSINLYELSN